MRFILLPLLFCISLLGYSQKASEICALNIGAEVPSAIIKDIEGNSVDIKNVASSQPTIIIFYRGGWCPYCTKHLSDIRKVEEEIKKYGYQVIALSTDDFKDIPKTIKERELNYKLYSDRQYNAMKAFGISFKPAEKRLPVYARVMRMLERDILVPVPSLFVIKEGIIEYRYVNPNYSTRLKSNILIEVLKSIE